MQNSKLKTKKEGESVNIRSEARRVMLDNYNATGGEYITPAWPHYKNQWVWDSAFHAISCASLDMNDLAINEIRQLFEFQDERGFIPHRIYHDKYVWFDLERPLYGQGLKPKTSTLSGQPVLAQAVEAINDKEFTEEVIEGLVKFYKYFIEYRDAENILSIITPRESGRDAAPEFDFFRPSAPRKLRFLEKVLDPVFVLWLDFRYMLLEWDEKRIMDKNLFHVKDLVQHCIFIDGLYSLKNLLEETERMDLFPNIDHVTKKMEDVVIEKAWDEATQTFYPLRVACTPSWRRGKCEEIMIKELSLGSVFPLLIKNLPFPMKKATLNHLTNSEEFWTEYPVPSVPASHPKFNPSGTFPIWRGPTWINTNWFLIRALMRQDCRNEAKTIADKTVEMIEREGFYEFYNPHTGDGMRVKDFGWSTLAVTFPDLVSSDS